MNGASSSKEKKQNLKNRRNKRGKKICVGQIVKKCSVVKMSQINVKTIKTSEWNWKMKRQADFRMINPMFFPVNFRHIISLYYLFVTCLTRYLSCWLFRLFPQKLPPRFKGDTSEDFSGILFTTYRMHFAWLFICILVYSQHIFKK